MYSYRSQQAQDNQTASAKEPLHLELEGELPLFTELLRGGEPIDKLLCALFRPPFTGRKLRFGRFLSSVWHHPSITSIGQRFFHQAQVFSET